MKKQIGVSAMAGLALVCLCGSTAPESCQPAPQPSHAGAVAAGVAIVAGAAIGTVVLVEVQHHHHIIKGCVTADSDGLHVRDERDSREYTLVGVTANTRPGDRVQLHGSKSKADKDSTAAPTFVVEKVSRDFGPCNLTLSPPANEATPAPAR